MAGNPKGSRYRNTTDAERHRPRLSVTVPKPLLEALRALAESQDRSLSEIVEEAIRNYVNVEHDPKDLIV